jgi:hypothetical protein
LFSLSGILGGGCNLWHELESFQGKKKKIKPEFFLFDTTIMETIPQQRVDGSLEKVILIATERENKGHYGLLVFMNNEYGSTLF